MPVTIPNAVSLSHDGDVWRATLGDHASNSLDPFEAILLTVGKAREAGHSFDSGEMKAAEGDGVEKTPIEVPADGVERTVHLNPSAKPTPAPPA